MKTRLFFALFILSSVFVSAQTFTEIENSVRANAKLIGADKSMVDEVISKYRDYQYHKDEFLDGKLIDTYYSPQNGTTVLLLYQDLPWYQYGRSLSNVGEIFYYPASQINSFLSYLDNRSVFKKNSLGVYQYVAFSNVYSTIMSACGYTKVIMTVSESIDNKIKNKYVLTVSISIVKD